MIDYLRWSLRHLYLILFWPTQFAREANGFEFYDAKERLLYLISMLPWIAGLSALGDLIAGYACEGLGMKFDWAGSLMGAMLGIWLGMALSVGLAITSGIVLCVTLGVAIGVPFGTVVVFSDSVLVGSVTVSVAVGVAAAVVAGVAEGAGPGVALGVVISVMLGIMLGVVLFAVGGAGLVGAFFACITLSLMTGAAFILVYFRLLTYPLDAALSVAAYCVGRLWPPAARAWRWCPVRWNEVIWLPLPFVGSLLALMVRQDREAGLARIVFVAAERKLQRRAALNALVQVAIDDLQANSAPGLADVTDRLGWTADAPAELPEELLTALPRFERVARQVDQYLRLNSSYRKRDALTRAINEAESLQRSLITSRGRHASRLLQVANEWRRLLGRESEKDKSLDAPREIPNPFAYGNPVMETEHNVFTGRRDVVKQIEASLLGAVQAPTLLLQGPRRMGKTSILHQLPRLLGPDFAPAVVDCQHPAVMESAATLLRYLSRALSEGLRRRRVVVDALAAQQLAQEPYAVFDEWLEQVEQAMPVGMRVLLCLDEYERLKAALEMGWGAPFLDTLRHTFQHRPRVVLMFTGAHTFQELGPAWTDRFVSARRMRVSFLTRADVELLLTKPIPEFDMTYAAGALDALVAATNCHPFLTQAVAFELVQLLNEGQRREATTADVEEAIGRALMSGDAYFVNVWGDAGLEGQAILSALAAGRTPPKFPAAFAWLREHDVVGANGDFAVEMLRRWVASKAAGV